MNIFIHHTLSACHMLKRCNEDVCNTALYRSCSLTFLNQWCDTGQKRKCSSTWRFVTMLQKEERNIKNKKCIYKLICTQCLYILKFLLYFKFLHNTCSKDISKQECTAKIFTANLPCLWFLWSDRSCFQANFSSVLNF
jgi:hypothetical protein